MLTLIHELSLWGVKVKSAIMGMTQSPLILAICNGDLDLADNVLKFLVKFTSYVDYLISGLMAVEMQQIKQEAYPSTTLQPDPCGDGRCCSSTTIQTTETVRTMALQTPPDEVRDTRHLLVYLVILEAAKLELALTQANTARRGISSSPDGTI